MNAIDSDIVSQQNELKVESLMKDIQNLQEGIFVALKGKENLLARNKLDAE